MGRAPRVDVGNQVYHIVNRANARRTIFNNPDEYVHFEILLKRAVEKFNMRLLAYALMPNHWHLLVYPRGDGDVSLFMQWLTLTHTQQYHVWKQTTGHGHIYQGRYKSFLVEKDAYLHTVIKYIERNPVRAKLVRKVEAWKWGSGYRRLDGGSKERSLLSDLPIDLPRNYELDRTNGRTVRIAGDITRAWKAEENMKKVPDTILHTYSSRGSYSIRATIETLYGSQSPSANIRVDPAGTASANNYSPNQSQLASALVALEAALQAFLNLLRWVSVLTHRSRMFFC